MKRIIPILLVLCMLVGLVACGGSDKKEESAVETPVGETASPKVLHIAPEEVVTDLDVMNNTSDAASTVVFGPVFEMLVNMNAHYQPIPELCSSWDVNEDSTEYVYHLREGVKFHNGEIMTADDVVASMNRWIDNVSTAQSFVGGAHFEKVDDLTVKISMDIPCPYMNNLIAGYANRAIIVPASVIANIDDTGILKEYIGTGPYVVAEIKEDQFIRLEKFADYTPYGVEGDFSGWGGYKHAYIDTVIFDCVPDQNSIANGLLTGIYQATSGIDYDICDRFEGEDGFDFTIVNNAMPMMIFNKKAGIGSNAAFRQGIAAAIDCDKVLYGATGNQEYYQLNHSYMFPDQTAWYSEKGKEYYNQADGAKAVELLTAAGYDFTQPFKLLVASDSADFYAMAIEIKAELDAAGIPCEIMTYDWSTFVQIRNNEPENYNAFITNFSPKTVPSLNLFLSATWAGWCDDEHVQSELKRINVAATPEEGAAIWADLQEYMLKDYVPVVLFGVTADIMINSSNVEGLVYMERIGFTDADIK